MGMSFSYDYYNQVVCCIILLGFNIVCIGMWPTHMQIIIITKKTSVRKAIHYKETDDSPLWSISLWVLVQEYLDTTLSLTCRIFKSDVLIAAENKKSIENIGIWKTYDMTLENCPYHFCFL